MEVLMKTCNTCKESKTLTDFYIRKSNGSSSTQCKVCVKANVNKYNKANAEARNEYAKNYRIENLEEVRLKEKTYKLNNKDIVSAYNAKYHEANKDKLNLKTRKYYNEHKDELNKKQLVYKKKRSQEDPIYNLQHRMRTRLLKALQAKSWKKATKLNEYIGCSLEEFKAHIESLFTEGMSWDNRSEWHLDHRIALSSATTEEEIYKLCHYTNLQPLWAEDNLIKGAKLL